MDFKRQAKMLFSQSTDWHLFWSSSFESCISLRRQPNINLDSALSSRDKDTVYLLSSTDQPHLYQIPLQKTRGGAKYTSIFPFRQPRPEQRRSIVQPRPAYLSILSLKKQKPSCALPARALSASFSHALHRFFSGHFDSNGSQGYDRISRQADPSGESLTDISVSDSHNTSRSSNDSSANFTDRFDNTSDALHAAGWPYCPYCDSSHDPEEQCFGDDDDDEDDDEHNNLR